MAEAVVGATIKVVLENLLSFPVEEIGLLWNFKEDLQKLKQSLAMIQDFLEDAETKPVTDKPVQRWQMKLEAVAYDADYVLDELNYRLLLKKVAAPKKMKKKVICSFFSTSNPIAFRHRMGRKIKEIKNKLSAINKEANELGLQMRTAVAPALGAGTEALAYLESDSFSADRDFVGRKNDVMKMVEMVTSSPSEQVISVIPIVGMGGLGKTTLAGKVFKDDKIMSHFGKRIWVHVSENFDPVIVLRKTLESLTGEDVHGSREVVLSKLGKSLEKERYLFVLDNVWNEDTDKWDNFIASLERISPAKGNVIMVTTRKTNVASVVKTLDVHELGGLSEEECWLIFKDKAFGGEGVSSEFETIGKNIAERCGGLPLAAKVAGSLLRAKSKDKWVSIEKKWLSEFGANENIVSKILKLSFDNLPSPSLKKCFAFFSINPKGWWVEKDELIHLWMAEGLLPTHQEKDMEIIGNEVFNMLLQSSLLQVRQRDSFGNVTRCDMHDLVHDLASSLLNQVRYISEPCIDNSSPFPKEDAKHLRALLFDGKASNLLFSKLKCLHVLYLVDEDIKELPTEIGMLISLRFLDISHTRIECLPDSIGDLYHLQTLRATKELGGESCLRCLPDTLKYLISLRHLCIPNIKLPSGIGNLVSLQTLPYFQVGDEEGCGIMELGSLRNLRGEIEIHNLEKVRDKEEAKSADLFHKPNIFKLKLVWNESREGEINDEKVLEGLQPHPNLKSLEIKGFKSRKFPSWTLQMAVREEVESHWVRFDNLIELKLSSCKEYEEIPMLGHLPNLKSLYLHHLSNVESLGSSFYGISKNGVYHEKIIVFPALEKLELIEMAKLTAWAEVEFPSSSETQVSVFGRLEYLKISNCRQLKSAPTHFPCIKELEIDSMESGLALANICGSKVTSLTKLIIKNVDGLVCLPDGLFSNNRDLLELEIWRCSSLTHLVPCLGGGGASLKKLVIESCSNFNKFPEDLHSLNALEELRISECPNLTSIAYQSDGQGFTSLVHLEFSWCSGLTNLPCEMLELCAPSLQQLLLNGSESLTNLPQVMSFLHKMPYLIDLSIVRVPKFADVAAQIGSVRSLQNLDIGGCSDCWDYVSFKSSLDLIFPALQSLRGLFLCGMEQWEALPDQLQHLTTLHTLFLSEFGIQVLPEWFGNLSSLNSLILINCKRLRHLPSKKAMQGLTKLTTLYITECPVIKQNLEEASDDSEWSKISHIPLIVMDGCQISPPAH